jgi:hypothetical protein
MAFFTNLVLAAVRLLLVITFTHQSQAKFKDLKGFWYLRGCRNPGCRC